MLASSGDRSARDVLDDRERGRFTLQLDEKSFELTRRALDLNNHSARIISHRTAEP